MNKVLLKIGKRCRCYGLPIAAQEKIKKNLTFENAQYKEAKEKGRFISSDTSPFTYFYAVNADKTAYQIPRGYVGYLTKWLKDNGYKYEIEDQTLLLPECNFKWYGKLRGYQDAAVNDMLTYNLGTLEASTGAGKTVMGCNMIVQRQQPTLIMVHNKELVKQWKDAIKFFLHEETGTIGDGKFDIKPITVGIVNTVMNNTEELKYLFGHIICDETHRVVASMFQHSIGEFPAHYLLGLSATPYRRDGLGYAIYATMGPKLHVVDRTMLQETGAVMKPTIHRVDTGWWRMYKDDYSSLIKELTKAEKRNNVICDKIYADLMMNKQSVVVVSDRVDHCEEIARILRERYKIDSRVLSSKVPKDKRSKIVEDVKNGKCKVLIATLNLIGEGFDSPNLSALFLCTPVSFSGRLLQIVGRILRPADGTNPRVYDFRDPMVQILKVMGFNRDRIYSKMGW